MGVLMGLFGLAGTWLEGKQKIVQAKADRESLALTNESDWDKVQAENARGSWKDEWLTLLISIPLVLAFIPDARDFVEQGFKALEEMPEWYQVLTGTVFAASFGIKKLANWRAGKV